MEGRLVEAPKVSFALQAKPSTVLLGKYGIFSGEITGTAVKRLRASKILTFIVLKDLKRGKYNKTFIDLLKGKIIAVVKKLTGGEEFTIKTKLAAATVKGTEFIVETGDEERVGEYAGEVEVASIDMNGNVLHKIVLKKDKENKIIKK
jgi:hypothetical protein